MYTRLQKEKRKIIEAYRYHGIVFNSYKQKYKDPDDLLQERVESLQNLHDVILSFSKRYHGFYLFSYYKDKLYQTKRLFKNTRYNPSEDQKLLFRYEHVRIAQNRMTDCAIVHKNEYV